MNIDILGITKLNWTGMGEFNSDEHYVYYLGKNSLKEGSSHHSQQKSPKCSTWMHSHNRMISVHLQGKPFKITAIQVYALTSNAQEVEAELRPTRPSRTNTQKRCPFHYR